MQLRTMKVDLTVSSDFKGSRLIDSSADELGGLIRERKWHGPVLRIGKQNQRLGVTSRAMWHSLVEEVKTMKVEFDDPSLSAVAEIAGGQPFSGGCTDCPVVAYSDLSSDSGDSKEDERWHVDEKGYLVKLHHDDKHVGSVRWFDEHRVLAWYFPEVTSGYVDESWVPGGFEKPTVEWGVYQASIFWEKKSLYEEFHKDPIYKKPDSEGSSSLSYCEPNSLSSTENSQNVCSCFTWDGCSGITRFFAGDYFSTCCDEHD